jgi:hypothetical protein
MRCSSTTTWCTPSVTRATKPTVLLISAFLEASEPLVIFHEGMLAP